MGIVPGRSHLTFDLVSLALDRPQFSLMRLDVLFDFLLLVRVDRFNHPILLDVG